MLARLHDDTFVALLAHVESVQSVAATVGRVVASVSRSFALEGRAHRLAVSVGESTAPRNGTDATALLEAAELACSASVAGGRHAIEWFSSDMSDDMESSHRLENELRLGIERGELVLYYQPIVHVDGVTIAVEALVPGIIRPGAC